MRTKLISLSIVLLIGVPAWTQQPVAISIYDDCSKNGQTIDVCSTTGTENGYTWVNLGLPSGIKWATCNVGATSPEGRGNAYTWGAVLPKSNLDSSCKYVSSSANKGDKLTKYCNNTQYGEDGFTDNKTTLELEDDVAHIFFGGSWRMPTNTDFIELQSNCTWTWITQKGVDGYRVTSKTNGNSIFFPATTYWSSSLDVYYPSNAWSLSLDSNSASRDRSGRCSGLYVRPVCP